MSYRIGPLQAAWLAEIGVDPHWLGLLGAAAPAPRPPAAEAPRPAAEPRPAVVPGTARPQSRVPAAPAAAVPAVPPEQAGAATGPGTARPAEESPPGQVEERFPGQTEENLPPATAGADGAPSGLQALDQAILACTACGLHAGRTRAVPGDGQARSPEYLIVGEMPGIADDAAGRPFEGQAGDLLRAMLAGARLPRAESAYLTNVLKCRPPGGRAAQAAEVAACLPHLRRQIEILRPRHILVLGRLAANALLGTRAALEDLRGREHAYGLSDGSTIPVWVTHHPASLLLRPAHKAQAWADLLALARAARDPAPPA